MPRGEHGSSSRDGNGMTYDETEIGDAEDSSTAMKLQNSIEDGSYSVVWPCSPVRQHVCVRRFSSVTEPRGSFGFAYIQ